MIYNFICTLKGIDFKYKIEAEDITEAKIKVREHIKNAVELEVVIPEPPVNKSSMDFINFFNETINKK